MDAGHRARRWIPVKEDFESEQGQLIVACNYTCSSILENFEYWFKELAKYKPLDVLVLDELGVTAQAVVVFSDDWNGFLNASEFEKSFESENNSKAD